MPRPGQRIYTSRFAGYKYMGRCEQCSNGTYYDTKNDAANDPRNRDIGENHLYAPFVASEQVVVGGRDIVRCFACSNDGNKYRQAVQMSSRGISQK